MAGRASRLADTTELGVDSPSPSLQASVLLALAGKALEAGSLVVLVTAVPRVLGPADYGTFGLALSLVAIGSAAAALGGPGLIRFIAAAPPAEQHALARALAARVARWYGACALGGVLLVVGLALVERGIFPIVPSLLVALALALEIGATLAFQLTVALGKTIWWSFRYPFQNLLLAAGALALYERTGVDGALAAIAVAAGAALLVGLTVVGRPILSAPRGHQVPPGVSRFFRLQGASSILVLLTHRGGVVAVALLVGSRAETGYAALAIGIALALFYVVLQIFVVTLPRLSALAREAPERADAELRHLAWISLVVIAPLCLLGAAFSDLLLSHLVGTGFAGANTPLAISLAVAPLAALAGSTGTAAAVHLRPEARLVATAAGAAVFVLGALALVPQFGASGAATALLASTAVTAAIGLWLFPALRSARLVALSAGASGCVLAVGLQF